MLFASELKKNAYASKSDIKVSDKLAKYVTFSLQGSGIENVLYEIQESLSNGVNPMIINGS